jgi:hypothetical protein
MDAAEIQIVIQTAVAAVQQHIRLSVKQVPQQHMLASPMMAQQMASPIMAQQMMYGTTVYPQMASIVA